MRPNRGSTGWFRGVGLAVAIFCLLCGATDAFGQQFVTAVRPGYELLAGDECEYIGASGDGLRSPGGGRIGTVRTCVRENQLGIESALVLSPQRTIRDARKWFEMAAGRGYAPAQVNLAVLYINGWGVERNYGAALYWLKSAADQGCARAHTNLGILYLKGWGVRQDYAEALKHFQFAAEHGETGAMVDLGFLNDADWGRLRTRPRRWNGIVGRRSAATHWGRTIWRICTYEERVWRKAMHWRWNGLRRLRNKETPERGSSWAICMPADARDTWMRRKRTNGFWRRTLEGDARGEEYLAPLEKQLSAEQLARAKERAQVLPAAQKQALTELAFVRYR